jgi:REP element-mobilizing transposase RayT
MRGQSPHSHGGGESDAPAPSLDVPRHARIEFPGAMHHVTARAPSRRLLFHDDRDRQRYLQLLAREVREREWRVLTYCQLSNHLHVLIQTPQPNLGLGFKRLHEDFARHVNRRHAENGHVFGCRFYNGIVSNDRHVVGCLRYIARNPVEAGVCGHAAGWPWSAHSALAGLVDPPSFLDVAGAYAFLGADDAEARKNYIRLVASSNDALLAELARGDPDGWLINAVDDFAIPVSDIATFLGVSAATAYRRVAAARENEGTVPSFSLLAEG